MIIFVYATLAIALIAPTLFVAIALGPVILGVLCAVGFGLIVLALGGLLVAFGWSVVSLERAGWRHLHHQP